MISMLACHLLFSSATRGRNQQYLPTSQGCRAGRTKRYNPHRDHAWQLAGAWYMLAIVISYLLWTWPSFNAYLGQGAPLPWNFFPDKEEGNINSDGPSILLPSFLHFILIFFFFFWILTIFGSDYGIYCWCLWLRAGASRRWKSLPTWVSLDLCLALGTYMVNGSWFHCIRPNQGRRLLGAPGWWCYRMCLLSQKPGIWNRS